jgi:hypothetical protein
MYRYGTQPYLYISVKRDAPEFLGGTWAVQSEDDLIAASALEGASKILDLTGIRPGGGKTVTIRDPDGFPINLVHGQTLSEPLAHPEKLLINYEHEKPRVVNKFQRLKEGPCPVHMLGHFGQSVGDFDTSYKWYTTTFNLVASDILVSDDGKDVGAFCHIDLGQTPTPHHSFFFLKMPTFEVHDTDSQFMGHQHLLRKGYELCWGVGRHILGSQIFDYWFGPDRFMIEHYCDSDYVNEDTPTGRLPAKDEALAVWGPDVPETFLT